MSTVFEEKNIQKTIWTLGVPAMLGQLATLIYNIVDTYFVSLTRSPAQIAAVTLCTPILLIVMSVSSIFGMGGGSLIARKMGAKETDEAKTCVNYSTWTMAFSGAVTLAVGLVLLRPIAVLAGADAENVEYTCDYLRWIFLGAPFIILATGLVHILRSTGLVKEATTGVIFGNLVNVALDWLFIVRLQMGTAGAAAATSIGNIFASGYYIVCMLRRSKTQPELFSLRLRDYRPKKDMVVEVIRIGVPGALITVMLSAANIVLNNYIARYGSDAVASYGIAYKIGMFPTMLLVGLSQGVGPLFGYCYGARERDRLNKAMRLSCLDGVLLGVVFVVFFLVAGKKLTAIFLQNEALIAQSALFLVIMCLTAPLQAIINNVTAYFQALGNALSSLVITVMRNAVLFIPAVIILNHFFGLNGTIAAQPVVEVLVTVLCLVMYVRARRNLKFTEPIPAAE